MTKHPNIPDFHKPVETTPVFEAAMLVLQHCSSERHCGLISAPSGSGKSTAVHHFAQNRSLVIVIDGSLANRRNAFLSTLLRQTGSFSNARDAGLLRMELVPALGWQGTMVVVDEAHQMAREAWIEVKHLSDETGCPFVFVGLPPLVGIIRGMVDINNRALTRRQMTTVSDANAEMLLDAWGVQCPKSRKFLIDRVRAHDFKLRGLAAVCQSAFKWADLANEAVEFDHFRKAWINMTGGEV